MTLKCAIIDDEPLAAELQASYVNKTPELSLIGTFNSAITAMKELRNNPADLLFLDIQMPELSGLEFAGLLPKETKVVFTTAFDQYAIDGYKVNAAGYLLKPIAYDDFYMVVSKIVDRFRQEERLDTMKRDRFIYIKSEYKLVRVDYDDILYVEGVKDYVKLYFTEGRKPIMSLMNMKKIEDYLPKPQFMRVHRSFIVNMANVSMIDRGRIVICDTLIPISESYKDVVQEYIDNHTLQ